MAFRRYYPTRDTSIANSDYPAVGMKDISDSNVGASEILNLYKTIQASGSSKILIDWEDSIGVPPGSQVVLKLFNAQHSETLPYGYSVVVHAIEQDWVEGRGLDMDYYTDLGVANNVSATLSSTWDIPISSDSASFFFSTGYEDLEVELSGGLASPATSTFGYQIEIDPSLPPSDLYIKKFHSRQTHFPTKKPYLEVRWSDWAGSTSSYQMVEHEGEYYPLQYFTSENIGSITTGSLSGTASLVTFPIPTVDPTGALVHGMPDLKDVYDGSEVVRLSLYSQRRNWNPSIVPTGSSATSSVVLTNAYYRVVDAVTDEEIVPFGVSPLPYTRLSYNDNGNYFDFDMSSMPTGTLLRFDFKYNAPTGSGDWTFVRGDAFKFRVTDTVNG